VANFGSFTFFSGDLYYVLPTINPVGVPTLYKLDKAWSTTSPTVLPAWSNTLLALPGTGNVIINNDTGNYSLFVNRNKVISLLYSGAFGTKLITLTKSGGSFALEDLTDTHLPTAISGEPNLGFALYVDDRRRTNEQHTIIVHFRPAIPQSILLFSWDGITPLVQTGTLDDGGTGLDLMVPDAERGDFRTFTNNQPSCHLDDASQPFPGRVRIDYTVQDANARNVDVIPEYSLDGQTWFEMAQGDGDSGKEDLATTAGGVSYFFYWDAYVNLDGNYEQVDIRVVARISGV